METEGGLFVTTTVSVIVKLMVDQASPLFPYAPFAVIPAMSTLTVPLPADGAVQSKDQARLAAFEWVIDLPLTLTEELPPVANVPLSTSTLNPPYVPDTLLETDSWIE